MQWRSCYTRTPSAQWCQALALVPRAWRSALGRVSTTDIILQTVCEGNIAYAGRRQYNIIIDVLRSVLEVITHTPLSIKNTGSARGADDSSSMIPQMWSKFHKFSKYCAISSRR